MLNELDTPRIAVLCSRRAPGIEELLHHPSRNRLYEVACVVTTEEAFSDRELIEAAGVPLLVHPLRRFHLDRDATVRDMAVRREYDAATAQVLLQLGVNMVVLLGYLYILTDRMLEPFEDAIINVHDSDLTLKNRDGSRRFVGLHSTRDAIVSGAAETRSTVHLVNREVDGGPVVLLSEGFPVAPFVHEAVAAEASDVVKAYAYAQREWMMRKSWGTLVVRAIEHFSASVFCEAQVVAR